MKTRLWNLVLAIALGASSAWASNLSLSVQQTNGTNAITVAPGAVVNYKVVGTLSDNLNRGLGLVSVSLDFDLASPGGDLTPANSPTGAISCANPMPAFDTPAGITNPPWPGGFGGTAIGGVLVQAVGAQNTIKNPNDGPGGAPDFPIGDVLLGVAQPTPAGCGPAVLLTGSLTIPVGTPNGIYNLVALTSGPNASFANVIANDGSGADFYTTEAVGAVTATNLAITVTGGDVPKSFVSSVPLHTAVGAYPNPVPTGSTFWRSAGNVGRLTFSGTIPAPPAAGQVLINELLPVPPGPPFGADVSASFAFSLENGPNGNNSVLRIRDGVVPTTPTANMGHRKWYAIRGVGWPGVNNFEVHFPVQAGDATGDNRVLQSDILEINTGISCVSNCGDQNRKDITGDGRVLQSDILEANTKISSLPVAKPVGH